MASKYFRAGSPFELIMTNEIVEQHAVIKEEVLKVLDKLSDEAENITLHHIEQEMNEHWWSGLGRAVVVVGGVISLALLWCPVASAAVGIGTCVVGFAIVGKSIYECRANSKKRIQQMQKIYKEVKVQLERYKVSQQTVFTDLGSYGFSQGNDFQANMEEMENMIKNAENTVKYGCCNTLEDFLKKVKTKYLELGNEQKETLGSEKFQMDIKDLMKIVSGLLSAGTTGHALIDIEAGADAVIGANAVGVAGAVAGADALVVADAGAVAGADAVTGATAVGVAVAGADAVAGAGADAVAGVDAVAGAAAGVGSGIGMWMNLFQGVSILVNGCFLIKDVWEYRKLQKMKNDWNNGDKEQIRKEEKFKVYFDLKNEILEITKQMRSYGY